MRIAVIAAGLVMGACAGPERAQHVQIVDGGGSSSAASGVSSSSSSSSSGTESSTSMPGSSSAIAGASSSTGASSAEVLSSSLAPSSSSFDARHWVPVQGGLPLGGITAVARSPVSPGVLFAGTYENGIFKSVDDGWHWQHAASSLTPTGTGVQRIDTIIPHPTNPDRVYATAEIWGVLRSDDGGTTWNRVTEGLVNDSYVTLALDPDAPDTLYTAPRFAGGLFRSVDGGNAWSAVGNASALSACSMAMAGGTLYVGSCGAGLVVVTQDGASIRADAQQSGELVDAVAVDPQRPGHVLWSASGTLWASDDAGLTRRSIPVNGGPGYLVRLIGPDRWSDGFLGVSFDGQVASGTLSDASWIAVQDRLIHAQANVLASENWLLVAGLEGVHILDDTSDTERNDGLEPSPVTSLVVDPANPQRMFAGVEGRGVYRSLDGGNVWTHLSSTSTGCDDLAMDVADHEVLYCGATFEVRRSLDGGETWAALTGLPDAQVFHVTAHPAVPGRIHVTTSAGVHLSDDKGTTWSRLIDVADGIVVQRIAYDPAAAGHLYGLAVEGLFSTENDGASWETLYRTQDNNWPVDLAAAPARPDRLFMSTTYSFYRSDDGGHSWVAVQDGLTDTVAHVTTDGAGEHVVAGMYNGYGVFISVDAGAHWSAVNAGLGNRHIRAMSALDPAHPVLATAAGVFQLR